MPRKKYWNCAVYGCLNSAHNSKGELSAFKLPGDNERRIRWLQLISREDVLKKPAHSYTVCEAHFNPQDIRQETYRKVLKKNALPSLHLPVVWKKDVQTLTESPALAEKCIQTEYNVTILKNVSTQTLSLLSSDRPRKRKRKSDILKSKRNNNFKESEIKSDKDDRDTFHNLCDTYLTGELAELVKTQTYLEVVGSSIP